MRKYRVPGSGLFALKKKKKEGCIITVSSSVLKTTIYLFIVIVATYSLFPDTLRLKLHVALGKSDTHTRTHARTHAQNILLTYYEKILMKYAYFKLGHRCLVLDLCSLWCSLLNLRLVFSDRVSYIAADWALNTKLSVPVMMS